MHVLDRQLIESLQSHGYEVRTYSPKHDEINERRHQLHDVIRLSGQNIVVNDTDHALQIKVASIPSTRVQVYFIDNEEFFGRRKVTHHKREVEIKNDERAIFFARGVLETLKKLCWTPDIIYCSGWITSLVPLYVKKAYAETPFFKNAKVVLSIDDRTYDKGFDTDFAAKLMTGGVTHADVRQIEGFEIGHEELMRLAIDNSDAVIFSSVPNQRLMNYALTKDKAIKNYEPATDADNEVEKYCTFLSGLLGCDAE